MRDMSKISRRRSVKLALGSAVALSTPNLAFGQSKVPRPGQYNSTSFMTAEPGFAPPLIPFRDENDAPHTIDEWHGGITLICFWATNCTGCTYEMPALSRLKKVYKPEGFRILPIAMVEDDVPKIKRFYQRFGVEDMPIYIDAWGRMFNEYTPPHPDYGARATPTTVVMDRAGLIRSAYVGVADWENEGLVVLEWYQRFG